MGLERAWFWRFNEIHPRRQRGADIWEPVLRHPLPNPNYFWSVYLPADGNRAAYVETGDFGTSPIFVQLSDKRCLPVVRYLGCRNVKHNSGSRKLRAAEFDDGVVRYWAPLQKDCGEQFYTDASCGQAHISTWVDPRRIARCGSISRRGFPC